MIVCCVLPFPDSHQFLPNNCLFPQKQKLSVTLKFVARMTGTHWRHIVTLWCIKTVNLGFVFCHFVLTKSTTEVYLTWESVPIRNLFCKSLINNLHHLHKESGQQLLPLSSSQYTFCTQRFQSWFDWSCVAEKQTETIRSCGELLTETAAVSECLKHDPVRYFLEVCIHFYVILYNKTVLCFFKIKNTCVLVNVALWGLE